MPISTYLNWLCREQANLVNVFAKSNGSNWGDTLPLDDAIQYIGAQSNYDAIWASIHAVATHARGKSKLSKTDITAYRYLAVDIDSKPAHARKLCATAEVRDRTRATAEQMSAMLQIHGLPQPLHIMSGNGSLLLFPIELPYTDTNYKLLDRFGAILARLYNNEWCDIDTAVIKDPSRILGVVGTVNRSKAELPSEGRHAMERTLIGEYPPNDPMDAEAFVSVVTHLCEVHEELANAVAERDACRGPGSGWVDPWSMDFNASAEDAFERCKAYLAKCPDAVSGDHGHDATLRAACECYRFGLSDAQAMEIMDWFNATKCRPSWSDAELRHKLQDAKEKVAADGRIGIRLDGAQQQAKGKNENCIDYPMTDVGNAEHFVAKCGDNLRYVTPWRAWLVYDGKRWARDYTDRVRQMGIRFVRRAMLDYAKTIKDDDARAKYLKWTSISQSGSKIDAMLSLASSMLACSPDVLDANGNLLNLANGTLELDTLTFRAHNRNDMLTKISPTVYEPNACAEQWENFLARIFQDQDGKPRAEVIAYLQRVMGYALTADTSEQCFWVLYGKGRNGKTTMMDAIKIVMGEYAINALPSVLLRIGDGRQSMNTDDEADLQGRRLVSVSETDEGQRMDEAKVKRLVGNGRVRAMRKYEQSFEFIPSHKLFVDCNHKPRVKGDDDGIWRRIKLIPFVVQISAEERDERMGEKLAAEASGVLNWMIKGLKAWREHGLAEPTAVSQASGEYRSESDTFGAFLAECVEPNDIERTAVAEVYDAYCKWSDANGSLFKLTRIEFGRRMGERGYESKPFHGVRKFIGCRLRTSHEIAETVAEGADERLF